MRRTRGWRMPAGTVYVGRPTRFGNPYRVGHEDDGSRFPWIVTRDGELFACAISHKIGAGQAVDLFREYVAGLPAKDRNALLAELRGRDLACWCRSDEPCHADVWLELANAEE